MSKELNIAVACFLDQIQKMGVGTDGVGHQKNKYVTLPTLLGQATTAANAHGLSYQNVVGMDVGYMTVTHILIHKETGEVYALTYGGPPLGAPGTAGPQINQTWGASRTYTVRTTLMSWRSAASTRTLIGMEIGFPPRNAPKPPSSRTARLRPSRTSTARLRPSPTVRLRPSRLHPVKPCTSP